MKMRSSKAAKQKPRKFEERCTEITRNRRRTARAKCVCGYSTEISWWWPWCIVVVTAGFRIHYVMLPENWWILHPDEVFQSMEVAFSEVHGYGFRPYEYLPPPNDTDIPAKSQMLQSGMFGLRSSIYPKIFMLVLGIAKLSGLENSAFMVCRIFNAVITSLLPITVYWFALKIFRCRLLALLTCALTAVEHHLAVFGTHTIVNSFISPLMFAGLALTVGGDEIEGKVQEKWREVADEKSDQNGNIISSYVKKENTLFELQQGKPKSTGYRVLEEDGPIMRSRGVKKDGWRLLANFLGGFLLGVVCYIRPDSALFCGSVILSMLFIKRAFVSQCITAVFVTICGGTAACMLCVADDFSWYGWGVISPIQWFRFNIMSGKSGKLFGTHDASLYLQVFTDSTAFIVLNLTFAAILIYTKAKQGHTLLLPRKFSAICFTFISNLVMFLSTGHKEKRFIHNIIVLYLLIVSYGFHTTINVISRRNTKLTFSSIIAVTFSIFFAMVSYSCYPTLNTLKLSDWMFGEARDSVDVNACLHWLRRQSDVSGVHINASLYDTAGFTLLQHDIPILVKIHSEFYLFDDRIGRKSQHENKRIRTIFDFDDFIHESNKLYLARILTRDKTFNYIITKTEFSYLSHIRYKYDKVFTYGQFNVFHTNFSTLEERTPYETPAVGDNATVLEYEANWLITNGLYQLATERIEGALKLDKSRVRLYQQMFVCYHRLNDKKMLFHYQEECFRRFGKQTCVRQQEKVVLNHDYNRFNW